MRSSAAQSISPTPAPESSLEHSALPHINTQSSESNEEAVHKGSVVDEDSEVPHAASSRESDRNSVRDLDRLEREGSGSDDGSDGDEDDDPGSGATLVSSEAQQDEACSVSFDSASRGSDIELSSPSGSAIDFDNDTVPQPLSDSMHDERPEEPFRGAPGNNITETSSTQGEDEESDTPSSPSLEDEAPQATSIESSAPSSASFEQVSQSQALPQTAVPNVTYYADQDDVDASALIAPRDDHDSPLSADPADFVFVAEDPSLGTAPVHEAMPEQDVEDMEVDTTIAIQETDDMNCDVAFPDLKKLKAAAGSNYDQYDDELRDMEMSDSSNSEEEDENMSEVPQDKRDDVSIQSETDEQSDNEIIEASESAAPSLSTNNAAFADFTKEFKAVLVVPSEGQFQTVTDGNGVNHEETNESTKHDHTKDNANAPLVSGNKPSYYLGYDAMAAMDGDSDDDNDSVNGTSREANESQVDENQQRSGSNVVDASRYTQARHDFPTEGEIEAALPTEGIEPNWLRSLFGERVPDSCAKDLLLVAGRVSRLSLGSRKYFPRSKASNGQEKAKLIEDKDQYYRNKSDETGDKQAEGGPSQPANE